jgi:HAD superfamily hydrolase (TIGR01509 family)
VGWPPQIPIDSNERLETIKQLHLKKTNIFMNLINDGSIPLRPGILRLVDEAIQNNVKLAVCSTSSVEAVTNLVQTLMSAQRASKFNIYAGDMVRRKKPAPDVYLMAVNGMSLQKEKCIIIEDSHIGLHAAMAAGIHCLVTKSSYTSNEDFTGAKCIVNELDDSITLSTLSRLLLDKDDNDNVESSTSDQRLSIVPNKSAAAATTTATTTTTWDRVGHVETAGVSNSRQKRAYGTQPWSKSLE